MGYNSQQHRSVPRGLPAFCCSPQRARRRPTPAGAVAGRSLPAQHPAAPGPALREHNFPAPFPARRRACQQFRLPAGRAGPERGGGSARPPLPRGRLPPPARARDSARTQDGRGPAGPFPARAARQTPRWWSMEATGDSLAGQRERRAPVGWATPRPRRPAAPIGGTGGQAASHWPARCRSRCLRSGARGTIFHWAEGGRKGARSGRSGSGTGGGPGPGMLRALPPPGRR